MKQLFKNIPLKPKTIIVWITIFLILFLFSFAIPQTAVKSFIAQTGPFAPLVFIALNLISYILAPLSGSPILLIGYALFGEKAVIYSSIAAWISFTTNFFIARRWGRGAVTQLVGHQAIAKIDGLTAQYGMMRYFSCVSFRGLCTTSFRMLPALPVSVLAPISWHQPSVLSPAPCYGIGG